MSGESNGRIWKRAGSFSIGMVTANFLIAILVDQFGVPVHPNVAGTGALFIAAIVNILVSKHLS